MDAHLVTNHERTPLLRTENSGVDVSVSEISRYPSDGGALAQTQDDGLLI